ncbi:serine hydrolase domain-containing protein [Streptomyces sp. RPT161]|uniref:serine hydrolase domain-containing protein n=1 Tax=Streptomyces sp. RPT161 TaxID=3015993 RepID=UPI0022B8BCB1|nr:serine hydrolase domain-containing protein [Streptomyces sp. RPT161]
MTEDDASAGLLRQLRAATEPAPVHPWCAGAVVLAGCGRDVVLHEAVGWALRYSGYDAQADRGVELPRERWIPMRRDTVFDLASLTKPFTAIAALQAIERGTIALDGQLGAYVPRLTAAADHRITVRQLLTHTSGLRAELPLYEYRGPERRLARLAEEEPLTEPGSTYRYSDLNPLLLQHVLERTTGRSLARLVRDGITRPLGMTSTRYCPPPSWRPRIAATEDQRRPWGRLDRGLVHGVVHDENAYAMGGVAGHAGLFSTAADLGALCRALLDGGAGVLAPASVRLMLTDAGIPGRSQGLGFELGQPWFMGELAGPRTAGHTGFTGTSLVVDFDSGRYVVLLANAVHPVRTWRQGNAPRADAATWLARYGHGSPRSRVGNDCHNVTQGLGGENRFQ